MPWDIEELDPETRAGLMVLGGAFARLRDQRGFSQRRLAQRVGISQSSVSRFEGGLAPGMRARHLARMLVTLQVAVGDLGLEKVRLRQPVRDPLMDWVGRMAREDEDPHTNS